MAVVIPAARPLTQGKEIPVLHEETTAAGSKSRTITLDSDTLLVSVQATVVSGTLDIEVLTETAEGQDLSVITFPTLSAPTTSMILREPTTSQVMQRIRFVATYTGACTFKINARGLGRGQSNIKILGNPDWDASKTTITSGTAQLVISAALTDRSGLVMLNNNLSLNPIPDNH